MLHESPTDCASLTLCIVRDVSMLNNKIRIEIPGLGGGVSEVSATPTVYFLFIGAMSFLTNLLHCC